MDRAIKICLFALTLMLAVGGAAKAQTTLLQSATSNDGLLTLELSSTNPSDTTGINNTYTWTAINNSNTIYLSGVILGSNWGDWCGGGNCTPPGPTLIALAPGCAGQGANEIPVTAQFGAWCVPTNGVTLAPGQSVSGSVTLRPGAGGPPSYQVYTGYNDPVTGVLHFATPVLTNRDVVAPAATDVQISGSASTNSPAVGSNFAYTYTIKNAGPWGTYGGVTFVDTLPASLTYVSSAVTLVAPLTGQAATVSSLCSATGQTVTCSLGELQNGGTSGQVTVTLNVVAPGTPQQIVNTASALMVLPQEDSNAANNSVSVTVASK